jgi:prepilin-type N-terminal cleavage/methylation domain-containing protein
VNRRGFSLLELLIALALLGTVATITLRVFLDQNQNWHSESSHVEVGLMSKGAVDEIARTVRMAGAFLPSGEGGLSPRSGPNGLTVTLNRTGWTDTVAGSTYIPSSKILRLAVDSASRFTDSGTVLVTLLVPPAGSHASPVASPTNTAPTEFRLPILQRVVQAGGCSSDSLVLDASSFDAGWSASTDVSAVFHGLVYNLDLVSYFRSHDTLFVQSGIASQEAYATGIDSLVIWYHHPVAGWSLGLSSTNPANAVDQVRIRIVARNADSSAWLAAHQHGSGGHVWSRLETDVTLRNDNLVNR